MSTAGSHHLWGNIGYRHSAYFRFANLMGFCYADHNPDSGRGGTGAEYRTRASVIASG
ncbi:MAG: hypothetical protein ABSD38_19245 [Syntrophorhabdales bacterium]